MMTGTSRVVWLRRQDQSVAMIRRKASPLFRSSRTGSTGTSKRVDSPPEPPDSQLPGYRVRRSSTSPRACCSTARTSRGPASESTSSKGITRGEAPIQTRSGPAISGGVPSHRNQPMPTAPAIRTPIRNTSRKRGVTMSPSCPADALWARKAAGVYQTFRSNYALTTTAGSPILRRPKDSGFPWEPRVREVGCRSSAES